MRISSNYYNYYNQSYNLSAMNNTNQNAANTSLTDSNSNVVSSSSRRSARGMGNAMMLSMNGSMMKHALQSQDSSEMAEKMETLRTDMDNIKSADVDKMSAADVKDTLTKLKADMQAMPARPNGKTDKLQDADLDSMSEADMRAMLEDVQEKAKHMPEMGHGFMAMKSDGNSEVFDSINEDINSIKSADLGSMSADSIKELLTKFQNDLKGLPEKDDKADEILNADIDNMTETDMREMLKKVQEDAKNAPEMKGGRPPRMEGGMPPMMQGMDLSQIFNSGSEDEGYSASIGSSDMQSTLQQILDKLTESYDSTTDDRDDYVAKLKESLTSMFNQQRSNIDSFSSTIFDTLDSWSSQEKASVEGV